MAQVVAVSVSQAVSAAANAVSAVATSDTQSATNISEALKSYVQNVTSVPANMVDIVKGIEEGITSRGGRVTDNVGAAVKIIARDLYKEIKENPDSFKEIGNKYAEAVDNAVSMSKKNLTAATEIAGDFRKALVDNIAGTAVMPLQIAKGVASNVGKTLFGGFDGQKWLTVFIIIAAIIIIFYLVKYVAGSFTPRVNYWRFNR